MATVFTTATSVDDVILSALDQAFFLTLEENLFVTDVKQIGLKAQDTLEFLPKHTNFNVEREALITKIKSALTLDQFNEILASTHLAKKAHLNLENFVPAEYGEVVTTTRLANIQEGGVADLAAAKVTAFHLTTFLNSLCLKAGEASTNRREGDEKSTITEEDFAFFYNRLSRANVPFFKDGLYRAILNPDVAEDAKKLPGFVLAEEQPLHSMGLVEAGTYKGFRVISATESTPKEGAGATLYYSQFFGTGAFLRGTIQEVELRLTGPFDKMGRFMHMGWYGVLEYKLISQDAHWLLVTGSFYADPPANA